jgi:hypothetical protein
MINIEVNGEDALQTALQGIMQALSGRVVAVVELNADGLITDEAIKVAIMEKYREYASIMDSTTALEIAVRKVARERGMNVIKIKAPARTVWVLYK